MSKPAPACEHRIVKIHSSDLPLCCPLPNEETFSAHPRVYLTLGDDNKAVCPYCSTEYHLVDEQS